MLQIFSDVNYCTKNKMLVEVLSYTTSCNSQQAIYVDYDQLMLNLNVFDSLSDLHQKIQISAYASASNSKQKEIYSV